MLFAPQWQTGFLPLKTKSFAWMCEVSYFRFQRLWWGQVQTQNPGPKRNDFNHTPKSSQFEKLPCRVPTSAQPRFPPKKQGSHLELDFRNVSGPRNSRLDFLSAPKSTTSNQNAVLDPRMARNLQVKSLKGTNVHLVLAEVCLSITDAT